MDDAVLAARHVSKAFAGVQALDDVSFAVRPGEVHALVGENGAGKSTLIKILTGVYRQDDGEVVLGGEPVRFGRPVDAQNAGVSTIYQEVNLVPLLSVAQNVFLGREPRTRWGLIDRRAMEERSAELLTRFGVTVDVRRPVRSLGLGVQQMVAIARAVDTEARVVIMDEPTSSLEPREVDTLFGVIRQLHAQHLGVVYVSHKMDELYQICDGVTVLRDGRMVHAGRLADLTRLELVALMLGRDLSDVRTGTTRFRGDHDPSDEAVLQVAGLRRARLLDGVSFDVRRGEVVGLGGLLGSGRSETVKAIAGDLRLDSGQVTVAGRRLRPGSTAAAVRAGVALLPEDRKAEGIIPNLSVRENIVLAALPRLSRAGLVSRRRQNAIVDTFMTRLRIKASSPDQRVSELSGGNQQKVMLARWLATSPRVLMLDEPTRGIDVGAKAEVQALVDELADEGLGVVLISSELEELLEGADRVVVLHTGGVVTELSGDEVTQDRLLAALADGAAPADGAAAADGVVP
jgi:ribose transport system ATP-binding protein